MCLSGVAVLASGGIFLASHVGNLGIENMVTNMSKAEILATASIDDAITQKEREFINERAWTLKKTFVAEGKGRGDFSLSAPALSEVCLTAMVRPAGLLLAFHNRCDLKRSLTNSEKNVPGSKD